jgi:hypothetical protein
VSFRSLIPRFIPAISEGTVDRNTCGVTRRLNCSKNVWYFGVLRLSLTRSSAAFPKAPGRSPVASTTVRRSRLHFAPNSACRSTRSSRRLSGDRWADGISVACSRRRGRGSRCAGSIQAQQARRSKTDAQASEEVCLRPRAIGHGRLAIIWRSAPRSRHRAPA